MKKVQYDRSVSLGSVAVTTATTAVKVSGFGPTAVAVQVGVSAGAAPSFSFQLQGSLDGTSFFNVGAAQAVTADGQYGFSDTAVAWLWYRANLTRTSGSFTGTVRTVVYGDTI